MIKSIDPYTKYQIVFIAEGETFYCLEEENLKKFKKSLLNLQNIDDRFLVDWNDIRVLSKDESRIKNYLLVKNSKNQNQNNNNDININNNNNMISLNLNPNGGVSILGDDKVIAVDNNINSNIGIDNLYNNNDDKSKTSLEVNKGSSVENIYNKNLNLRSINDINNNNKYNNKNNMLDYTEFIQNFYNTKDNNINSLSGGQLEYDRNNQDMERDSFTNNYISFNEKISKILKDPIILKLEDYIKNFKNINENKENKGNKENENLIEVEKGNDNYELNFVNVDEKKKDIKKEKENNYNNENKNKKLESNINSYHNLNLNSNNNYNIDYDLKLNSNYKSNNSIEDLKKLYLNKNKNKLNENYKKSLKKVLDINNNNNNDNYYNNYENKNTKKINQQFLFARFKENQTDIKIENYNKNYNNKDFKHKDNKEINDKNRNIDDKINAERIILKEKIMELFLDDLKFCFNKGYYSKEFNFHGNGNFKKCYNLVEKLNKKNVKQINEISNINNVASKIKYNKEEVHLDNFLKESFKKTNPNCKKSYIK